MYFDPVSGWLVALLVDGAVMLSEQTHGKQGKEFVRNEIENNNKLLNNDIRRIKDKYGFISSERQLKEVQRRINNANSSLAVEIWGGQIHIDSDNQDYIIELLEACIKQYYDNELKWSDSPKLKEEYRAKIEEYEKVLDNVKRYRVMRFDSAHTQNDSRWSSQNEPNMIDGETGCLIFGLVCLSVIVSLLGIIHVIVSAL